MTLPYLLLASYHKTKRFYKHNNSLVFYKHKCQSFLLVPPPDLIAFFNFPFFFTKILNISVVMACPFNSLVRIYPDKGWLCLFFLLRNTYSIRTLYKLCQQQTHNRQQKMILSPQIFFPFWPLYPICYVLFCILYIRHLFPFSISFLLIE